MEIHCKYDALVPLEELIPNPHNANDHTDSQIKDLAEMFEYYGIRHPIICNAETRVMAVGHGRLLAAKRLKMPSYPVVYQPFVDEDQFNQFAIADNGIALQAELNLSKINKMIPSWGPEFKLNLLGIKDFVLEPADKYGDKDADETPDTRTTDIALGDMFSLGNHRLLCGDSTDKAQVERLMSGEKADMVFTDPPYGIGYEYNEHNDSSPEENFILVANAFKHYDCGKVWTPGKMNLERDLSRFGAAKIAIWYKKFAGAGSGLGGASTFEPILIVEPKERKLPNDVIVLGTDRETLNGVSLRELHSCPKPVDLYAQLILAFSASGDKIAEPFCGSGSTLIACEKTNRKCYGMEIDPIYIDVIIRRWEKFTGQKAVKL